MTLNLRFARIACAVFLAAMPALAQLQPRPAQPRPSTGSSAPSTDQYSGMYSVLQDGEFVQVDVLADGKLSGFISRYGELDSD